MFLAQGHQRIAARLGECLRSASHLLAQLERSSVSLRANPEDPDHHVKRTGNLPRQGVHWKAAEAPEQLVEGMVEAEVHRVVADPLARKGTEPPTKRVLLLPPASPSGPAVGAG